MHIASYVFNGDLHEPGFVGFPSYDIGSALSIHRAPTVMGLAGAIPTAFFVHTVTPTGELDYEWNVLFTLDNYSYNTTGDQDVAFAISSNKQ